MDVVDTTSNMTALTDSIDEKTSEDSLFDAPPSASCSLSVSEWSSEDVRQWALNTAKVSSLVANQLAQDHALDGNCLLVLSEDDLRQPPLSLSRLGDIKKLAIALRALQSANPSLVLGLTGNSAAHGALSTCLSEPTLTPAGQRGLVWGRSGVGMIGISQVPTPNPLAVTNTQMVDGEDTSEASEVPADLSSHDPHASQCDHVPTCKYEPETHKALLAMFYFLCVTWITSVVMVIVHDRVPDMHRFPPLPDLFLDNVPHIPGAFEMCELCGLCLLIIWCIVLITHKHRFILLRRMFSMYGTVFLLRCFSMLITSLSVPGKHLECKSKMFDNWRERLIQAYYIWTGGGMSIQGVRTCGDYMFSGHTVVITLMNFFITEYTPPDYYFLHTFTWVLNMFGIFFILAAHEHYSIDVFIAFYISTRLFLYYHTLANNRACQSDGAKRTRIWFPMFYFFESNVIGSVPNEYEYPIDVHRLRNTVRAFRQKILLKVQQRFSRPPPHYGNSLVTSLSKTLQNGSGPVHLQEELNRPAGGHQSSKRSIPSAEKNKEPNPDPLPIFSNCDQLILTSPSASGNESKKSR